MKRVVSYAKPYLLLVIVTLVLKLGAAMIELQIPTYLADIIDVAVPTGLWKNVVMYGLKMLLFAFMTMIVNLTANILASFVTSKIVRRLRQDLFTKVSHLSARQMDEVTIPSAVSRLTSDTYNINNMFTRCLRMGVRAPILMLGGIFMTFRMDPVLTIMLVVALPLITWVTISLTRKAIPMYTVRQEVEDRMIRTVRENATGIRVIKALSKGEFEMERYDKVNTELADKNLEAGLIMAKSRPLTTLILNFSLVGVVVLGAIRVNSGAMLPGKIVAFINYFTIILNTTLAISAIFTTLSHGAASANRITQVLEYEDDLTVHDIPAEKKNDNAVEFRSVSFSYNGVEENVSDLNFALKKGQTLGIIGSTGSGKTTILNLLLRFYDVDKGQILIGGRDVRSIPNDELRAMFGVTFQNDFVVAQSIQTNIDFFRGLTDEDVQFAAHMAQADDFIASKEDGLKTRLTIRGNNLSGGQKQRLLIARALAGKPEILILDDASSALDYKTDSNLRKALAEGYADTTKLIVAQRVSSIRSADLILVMDNGEVIGQGTHDELMQTCPAYQEIARVQMETEYGEEAQVHA